MKKIVNGLNFIEAEDYKKLSEISAKQMIKCVKEKPDALICIATGASPKLAYELFNKMAYEENIDLSRLRIIKLDEWLGVKNEDPATSEFYIRKNIIEPLRIKDENYIGFNASVEDGEAESSRINDILKKCGPIDLCILGLGKNGHLGLNEPGEYLLPYSHVTKLTEKSKTHDMLKKTDAVVNYGITLGIKDILSSNKILFMVSGDEKKEAFNAFLEKKIRSSLPASMLWLHDNVVCVFESKCK